MGEVYAGAYFFDDPLRPSDDLIAAVGVLGVAVSWTIRPPGRVAKAGSETHRSSGVHSGERGGLGRVAPDRLGVPRQ